MHHAMMKALSRLQNGTAAEKRAESERQVGKNIELIAHIKSKIAELENDNDNLADENEELRQFSLDGYQIAKNVQALTAEREKLSVDLADKAATIRRLLDENESLSMRLRQTQEAAANLMASNRRR